MEMKTKILIFVIVVCAACEERIDAPLQIRNTNLVVVEGVLTNENKAHSIKLTLPYQTINGKSAAASGATVKIYEGTLNNYPLIETPVGSGEYHTPPFSAVFGSIYTLLIQYQGNQYLAQDSSIPVEPLSTLDYQKVNDRYKLVFNASGDLANYIDYSIYWQTTPECLPANPCEGRLVFYDLKTIDVNEIFKPAKEDFSFPVNSVVIRKKYSVSPAYRAFLRSVLSETEWRGGLFDVDRANATTNLSAGAAGFFAVTTVLTDTTAIVEKP